MSSEAVVKIGTILIALIGAIITYVVIPYVKSKTTSEQFKTIEYWVKFAVQAAEQIFSDPGQGEKKKAYVIKFLKNMGLSITADQLDVLIEAAVHELNQAKLLPIALSRDDV